MAGVDQQNTSILQASNFKSKSKFLQASSLKDFAIIQFAQSWKFKTAHESLRLDRAWSK